MPSCKICSSESELFGEGTILNKYNIKYYKCPNCGFLQTEDPYWLEESYSDAINKSDVGYIHRNLILAKVTRQVILKFFDKKAKFIDYGTGYGIFVRLMRDYGFDFYGMDKYCEIIFAGDFTVSESDKGFELLTAFELFEHLVEPLPEVENMLRYSDSIFFSTELFPSGNPKPGDWWYYGLDHGQHVAIYSKRSLEVIAEKFGLNLYTNGKNLHLLTKKKVSKLKFKFISYYNIYHSVKPFSSNKSLLDADYKMIVKKIHSEK